MEIIKLHPQKRIFFLFLSAFILAACAYTSGAATSDRTQKPGSRTALAAPTQPRTPQGTPAGEPILVATFPSGGKIFLLSPQPNDAVTTPWVDVVGTAPADTVITLNDGIAVSGADGYFYARVPLAEGLNEIQCVGSDLEGNEVSFSFVISYEPEP